MDPPSAHICHQCSTALKVCPSVQKSAKCADLCRCAPPVPNVPIWSNSCFQKLGSGLPRGANICFTVLLWLVSFLRRGIICSFSAGYILDMANTGYICIAHLADTGILVSYGCIPSLIRGTTVGLQKSRPSDHKPPLTL